jgi:hypothetical protein
MGEGFCSASMRSILEMKVGSYTTTHFFLTGLRTRGVVKVDLRRSSNPTAPEFEVFPPDQLSHSIHGTVRQKKAGMHDTARFGSDVGRVIHTAHIIKDGRGRRNGPPGREIQRVPQQCCPAQHTAQAHLIPVLVQPGNVCEASM